MLSSNIVTYVCTILESCNQTFNEYIDWCEHEEKGHSEIIHIFYCNGLDGCKEGFYNEKEFKRHFEEMHPAHSLWADDYLLDPFYKRFWCGVCMKVIDAPEYSWYSEFYRACHIQAHFEGSLDKDGNYRFPQAHPTDWIYIKVR